MNFLTRPRGNEVSSQLPLQVDDVTQSSDRTSISGETVTFNAAGAASSTGVNALDKSPVLNLVGDKVGSYWGNPQNKMMEFVNKPGTLIGTLTETATSASVVITDNTNVLDKLFETASGSRRYILKAIDSGGNVLYGWIGDITVSGVNYTFPIHNAVTGGAQSWVGTLASFDNTAVARVEIYSYQSSLVFVTGTVLTEEVEFKEENVQTERGLFAYLNGLSAGQYGVNYRTGAIYFKKATTGTSDTVNYSHPGGGGGGSALVDDSAFGVGSDLVSPTGFLADETATDSVDEGDIGVARMTLDRRQVNASEYAEDTVFANASYLTLVGAEVDDPTALAAMTEGDVGNIKTDLSGRVITTAGTLSAGEDLSNNLVGVLPKPVVGTTYTGTRTQDLSFTTTNLKATPGNVLRFEVTNTTGATRWFQLHNTATTPGGGATAQHFYLVPANSQIILGPGELTSAGLPFTTGIAYANSTTASTYTAGTAGDLLLNIRHV